MTGKEKLLQAVLKKAADKKKPGSLTLNAKSKMKKKLILYTISVLSVLVFTTPLLPKPAHAMPKPTHPKAYENTENGFEHLEKHEHDYTESIVRRGEIIFLLSFPFVSVVSFGVSTLAYMAATGDTSMRIPPMVSIFAIGSSVIATSAIVYYDTQRWSRDPRSARSLQEQKNNIGVYEKEPVLYAAFTRRLN